MSQPEDLEEARRAERSAGDDAPLHPFPAIPPLLREPLHDGAIGGLADRLEELGADSTRFRRGKPVLLGGMGRVTRSWDGLLSRHVAVKTLRLDLPASHRTVLEERFLDEALITAQLQHPAVASVLDAGCTPDGEPFFVMPWLRGQSLEELLAEEHAEPADARAAVARTARLLLQVCDAVAYAHERGVIHRDLKPANVMVGRHGEVYVMDWGLARVLSEDQLADESRAGSVTRTWIQDARADRNADVTLLGEALGTPAYMPPEQARGARDELGPHSDVYSLGAMLYHVLAGSPPYTAQCSKPTAHTVLTRLRAEPPEPLRHCAPRCPVGLREICERAMARHPVHRYANAAELAADLRRWLDTRPTAEASRWQALRLAVRRNRGVLGTAAVALAALLGSMTWFLFELDSEAHRRQLVVDRLEATVLLERPDARYPLRVADRQLRSEELRHVTALHDRLPADAPSRAGLQGLIQRLHTDQQILAEWAQAPRPPDAALWVQVRDDTLGLRGFPAGLPPQEGLRPLRRDPHSGLWEFLVIGSGDAPSWERDGPYLLDADTGIVMVLLRVNGMQTLLFQGNPSVEVPVRPFLLGKYEITQGQWRRLIGFHIGYRNAGTSWQDERYGWTHPVDTVTWFQCEALARRFGLRLPSEAEFQAAMRGPGDLHFGFGDDPTDLIGRGNFRDGSTFAPPPQPDPGPWSDGYAHQCAVDALPPNGFGLHGLYGNLHEWCADRFADDGPFAHSADREALERLAPEQQRRAARGTSYNQRPHTAHSQQRFGFVGSSALAVIGCRMARDLR